jgi:hypothetical protein
MAFDTPVSSSEALSYLKGKMTLPTDLRTWALDKLTPELRQRLAFSAGVTKAEIVDEFYGRVQQMVSGTADRATMRLKLKEMLQEMDYSPKQGQEGGLKDLSSDKRLNLVLDTNVAQAQSYAWWQAGQEPELLNAFPAQEFLRVESRINERNWSARWDAARMETQTSGATASSSGRMVALKNHPIWSKLSRFGTPYEPFDFNSGMGVEDVDRADAIALGIIDATTQLQSQKRGLNDTLQASPSIANAALRKELEATGIGSFDASGVFRLKGGKA